MLKSASRGESPWDLRLEPGLLSRPPSLCSIIIIIFIIIIIIIIIIITIIIITGIIITVVITVIIIIIIIIIVIVIITSLWSQGRTIPGPWPGTVDLCRAAVLWDKMSSMQNDRTPGKRN